MTAQFKRETVFGAGEINFVKTTKIVHLFIQRGDNTVASDATGMFNQF